MANVNDYLIWRGDIPFSKKYDFNEIDSLILARFSYLVFHRIKMNAKETIESISQKMECIPNEDFLFNGDKDLIHNLGISERFKDLIVTDYVRNNDKDIERQFGAITIHLSDKKMYVSYIGTDSSINGWKEDFNMMFLDDVPCQKDGKKYLEKISKKYPDKKILIGGHSKGGNVAIYSAIFIDKTIQQRIVKVYNYDGPGLKKEVLDNCDTRAIMPKIITYIPQDSVVGRLLYHREEMRVTLSVEKGIMQHDIYSWQVLKDDLIYSESATDGSEVLDETITTWFEETTNEQRRIVVDTIFELFYSTNKETFVDLGNNLSKTLPIIIRRYGTVSKEDKKMISLMIRKILRIYLHIINDKEKQRIIRQFIRLQIKEEI